MEDGIGVMNKPFWLILDFVVTAAFVAKCQQHQLRVVCQNLIVIEFSGGAKWISSNYANLSYSVVGQEYVDFFLLDSPALSCSPKSWDGEDVHIVPHEDRLDWLHVHCKLHLKSMLQLLVSPLKLLWYFDAQIKVIGKTHHLSLGGNK